MTTVERMLPVLVYGTLRPGQGNYDFFLKEYAPVHRTVLLRDHTMYGGAGYPYIIPEEGGVVVADLIVMPEEHYAAAMAGLDALEGYQGPTARNHYDRNIVTVEVPGYGEVEAYVYVASPTSQRRVIGFLPRVEHGDWVRFRQERYAD